jgi:hypothetical protein
VEDTEAEVLPTLRPPIDDVPSSLRAPRRDRKLALNVAAAAAVCATLGAAVYLRFATSSALWLDEALSVNIARLPLHAIPEALRQDGAPPLYYLLLHGWMKVFGTGDLAVRSLSGVFSVAALPLAWLAGRRIAGRAGAWASLVLLATSPFAIRYATEARMYALLAFLVLLGYLALSAALDEPAPGRLLAVAVVSGLLALTHYWALYLLAATAGALALAARRRGQRRAAGRTLGALAAGGVLFAPWLGTFLFQVRHTGTPWYAADMPRILVTFLEDWSGPHPLEARLLAIALFGLLVLGLFGHPLDGHRIELDLHGKLRPRGVAAVGIVALAGAVTASYVTQTAIALRYTTVVLPLFVLAAGAGFAALPRTSMRYLVLGVVAALGLLGARGIGDHRTDAGQVANVIRRAGSAGDVVGYCPDQLGPPVDRLLGKRFEQFTFPALSSPRLVDWVDYVRRNQTEEPASFVDELLRRAAPGANVWLVSSPDYKGPETRCDKARRELLERRPAGFTALSASEGDKREAVDVFPAGTGGYWVATADGHVRSFGDAPLFGDAAGDAAGGPIRSPLAAARSASIVGSRLGGTRPAISTVATSTGPTGAPRHVVGIESTPTGRGYWLLASDGTVLPFGDAQALSPAAPAPGRTAVAMAVTPSGEGYWVAMADGGVLPFGDARELSSPDPLQINGALVGIGATPTGRGYWLFAADGGVFSFGDAPFLGSATDLHKQFVSGESRKGEAGYWLLGSDGTVFTPGDDSFFGAPASFPLGSVPITLAGVPSDRGYRVALADGTILSYSAEPGAAPVVTKVPGAVAVEGWVSSAEPPTRRGRFSSSPASPVRRNL